eukprot:scaffold30305_cov84-Isochrysis_galbana.AAC.1
MGVGLRGSSAGTARVGTDRDTLGFRCGCIGCSVSEWGRAVALRLWRGAKEGSVAPRLGRAG